METTENLEIVSSYCPGSRVHALIDNPSADSIDGN
jgi:hypothetical protein